MGRQSGKDGMSLLYIITAFILGAISVLSGVALGGFLVYRTKREAGEPLFMKSEPGEAFNLENDDISPLVAPKVNQFPVSKVTEDASDRFVEAFAKGLKSE